MNEIQEWFDLVAVPAQPCSVLNALTALFEDQGDHQTSSEDAPERHDRSPSSGLEPH
jgi:hypothetical protein